METIQDPGTGSGVTTAKSIPYFAEMIDTYLTLHYDYLQTDSISASEDLLQRLEQVEADMKERGCVIECSTTKWQEFLCSLSEINQYDQMAANMFREAETMLQIPQALTVLQCLRTLEEVLLNKAGRKASIKAFYAHTDIVEIVNGHTLLKNVTFCDLGLVHRLAIKNLHQ